MVPRCRQAVDAAAAAAGRARPTQAQYQRIEDLMAEKMRALAWRAMSRDQQMQTAASAVMQDIADAAQRKLDNAQRQVLRVAETENRIKALQDSFKGTKGHDGTRAEALKQDFVLTNNAVAAERKFAMGGLFNLIEAAGDKQGTGMGRKIIMAMFDADNNPGMTRDIVKEIFKNANGHTGNSMAKTAARAWLDTIEGLRTRFNAAGGDVGKLEYGWTPYPWDTARIRRGRDAFPQFMMDHVDRSRYVLEDGSRMSDSQMFDFLNKAVETRASEGLNKQEPGQFTGQGARANRGMDHRQIHLKDGDSWNAVMAQYGRGSIYDAMMSHVSGMARDITLIERYGPDSAANARLQFDLAARHDDSLKGRLTNAFTINPETFWDMISGKTGAPVDEVFAHNMQMVRSLQTAAQLGAAVISSTADLGTLAMTAGYNKLPYWQLIKDIGAQSSKETRDFMATHGMIAEGAASAMNRWAGDHLGSDWSGKLANSVLRWSFLNAWTDGLRQGFTLSMNAGLAKWTRTAWGTLSEFDRSRLTRAGFTEADWQALGQVAPTQWKGRELLTPQSILGAASSTGTPPPAAGMIRYYHGGNPAGVTGKLWFTSHLPDAEGWAARDPSMKVWYTDVPANHPVRGGDPVFGVLPPSRMELPGEFADKRQLLATGKSWPSAAHANALAAKVFGFIHDESEFAVVNPDLKTRAITTFGGQQAGTYGGEIARTVMQFKSFPIAMMTRHWSRMLEGDHNAQGAPMLANRVLYGMALMATLTGLGAVSVQEKQLLGGKDPIDMNKGRFWAKAVAQGGGLSILGDLFLVDPASSGADAIGTFAKNAIGPTLGTASDLLLKVVTENIWQAAEGKDSHWEAELFGWAKAQTPAANLWWLKPFVEHGFTNAIQESLSPGYLSRVQQRAQKDWGNRWWWRPQDTAPQRAPDVEAAFGR